MKTKISFRGHSDDVVVVTRTVDGVEQQDEVSAYSNGEINAEVTIVGPAEKCPTCGTVGPVKPIAKVIALYRNPGVWTFAVAQVEEDSKIPFEAKLVSVPSSYTMDLSFEFDGPLGVEAGDETLFEVES